MSDDKPVGSPAQEPAPMTTQPETVSHETVPQGAVQPATEPPRRRFVDRLWGLKAVVAVALASVLIGGLGGAALAKAGDRQGGDDRRGPGFGHNFPGGPGNGRGPDGFGPPGQRGRGFQQGPGGRAGAGGNQG